MNCKLFCFSKVNSKKLSIYLHEKNLLLLLDFFVCRTILAVLHFNENIQRDKKTTLTGEKYLHITYPKYKLGDEVVREVAVDPTYSMCLKFHFGRN